ncbi:hypothetical protein B0H14DRAFT_2591792 [Mycena olivaceomarginata]|nr:hypothetical protein B0H14DRAFT_2591792 [Mycena olivaceomarginata]
MFCLLRPGLRWPRIFFCLLELLLMLSDQFFTAGGSIDALGFISRGLLVLRVVFDASLVPPLEGLNRSLWIVTGVPEHRSCRRELATVRELAQFTLACSPGTARKVNALTRMILWFEEGLNPGLLMRREASGCQLEVVSERAPLPIITENSRNCKRLRTTPRSPIARTEMKIQCSRFHEMSVRSKGPPAGMSFPVVSTSPGPRAEINFVRIRLGIVPRSGSEGFDESARSYRICCRVFAQGEFGCKSKNFEAAVNVRVVIKLPDPPEISCQVVRRDDFASRGSFGWKLYHRQIEFLTIAVVWDPDLRIASSGLFRQSARVSSFEGTGSTELQRRGPPVSVLIPRNGSLKLTEILAETVFDRKGSNLDGFQVAWRSSSPGRGVTWKKNRWRGLHIRRVWDRIERSFGSLVNELEPGNCHTHRPKKGERIGRSAPANKWRSLNRIAPGRTLAKARGEKVKLELVHEHVI